MCVCFRNLTCLQAFHPRISFGTAKFCFVSGKGVKYSSSHGILIRGSSLFQMPLH